MKKIISILIIGIFFGGIISMVLLPASDLYSKYGSFGIFVYLIALIIAILLLIGIVKLVSWAIDQLK